MRKLFLSLALISAVAVVNAQDMTSKRGVQILPEADEWALGFDATPLLEYFGNLFTDSFNDGPSFDFTRGQSIWIKKVRDEGFHYRGSLRIGFGSTSMENNIPVVPNNNDTTFVVDERSTSMMNIAIGAGFEKRRGKGRLQGYYGPELTIGFGSSSTEYSYGNAFSQNNTMPNTTIDFNNGNASGVSSRTTESVNGSTFSIGLRGFVGLEYFFAPKLSVGGEFGWGLALNSSGEGETTTESWDILDNRVETRTTISPGASSSFNIDTDNLGGAIRLVGYF